MAKALIENSIVVTYPATLDDVVALDAEGKPTTISHPTEPDTAYYESVGLFDVENTARQEGGHNVESAPDVIDGRPVQVWAFTAYTDEEQTGIEEAERGKQRHMLNVQLERDLAPIKAKYTQAEIDTWPIQEAEAMAFELDSSAPTPFIDDLIGERLVSKEAFVENILENSVKYRAAVAAALNKKQAAQDPD